MSKTPEMVSSAPRHEFAPSDLLPVRIADSLLPQALQAYNDTLTPMQQLHYERGLHQIQRMNGLREEGIPIPEGFESDLEHVVRGCDKARQLHEAYPALQAVIDFAQVQQRFVWHDAGELIIGDIRIRNRTREITSSYYGSFSS
jgi:hypothetical protein